MNFQIFNDKVYTFPIKCHAADNVLQAFPPGYAPSAISSNPASLTVQTGFVSGGGFSLTLIPKVQGSSGLTVTVSAVGMASNAFVVDIVPDPDLLTVAVDTSGVTTATQNVPTAPGP